MTKIIKREIESIKERNARVETDKAWETSKTRKVIIALLTYIVLSVVFYFIEIQKPLINAIIPTAGFILSTLTLPAFKKLWIKYIYKK